MTGESDWKRNSNILVCQQLTSSTIEDEHQLSTLERLAQTLMKWNSQWWELEISNSVWITAHDTVCLLFRIAFPYFGQSPQSFFTAFADYIIIYTKGVTGFSERESEMNLFKCKIRRGSPGIWMRKNEETNKKHSHDFTVVIVVYVETGANEMNI